VWTMDSPRIAIPCRIIYLTRTGPEQSLPSTIHYSSSDC
jgi:hypothetical protein